MLTFILSDVNHELGTFKMYIVVIVNVVCILCLQEKEKLYVELKHILARQPGPETAEKLQVYQRTLREKTKQLKVRFLSYLYLINK